MAFPTAVNNQITDAVTQTNVKTTGEAPVAAMDKPAETTTGNTAADGATVHEKQDQSSHNDQ